MIQTQGIHKTYADFQALQPLDLHVRHGEVFGFLGPNGAGKTTTIRILSGVLPPSGGSLSIDGVSMTDDPVQAKARIGYIPDRPYLYEKLTAREMLHFVGGLYGMAHEDIESKGMGLLEQNDLQNFADRLIEGFSHGMKQRLTLSCALLHDPALLIVDEPMVGLDPRGARLVKRVFREICASGELSVFLSTHTLEVAEEVCDRIAIMNQGQIVVRGTMDELRVELDRPGSRLEEIFLRLTEEASAEETST